MDVKLYEKLWDNLKKEVEKGKGNGKFTRATLVRTMESMELKALRDEQAAPFREKVS